MDGKGVYIECSRDNHLYKTSYSRKGRIFPAIFDFFVILKSVLYPFQKKMLRIEFKKVKWVCQNHEKLKNCGKNPPLSIVTCLVWMFVSTTFYVDRFRYKTTKNENYIITM